MDLFYQTYIAREDQIYQSMPRRKPVSGQVDPPELEFGVDWLCHGAHSVLDFGCGNGSLLFACAYRGVDGTGTRSFRGEGRWGQHDFAGS